MHLLSAAILGAAVLASTGSPAAQALARGEIDRALTLKSADSEEARYLEAWVALARFDHDKAARLKSTLPAGSRRAAELEWHLAHRAGDNDRIARAASALCALGDVTGRACAEAQLRARKPAPRQVELDGDRVEIGLARGVPVPLTLGRIGGQSVGVIIDTGASESVISASLARKLGVAPTEAAFPVGVAAGAGRADARLAVAPEVTLGALVVRNLPVLV
ncbi:MAG: aspartyl protease family protein, partial [Myxococcales bacterium]